MLRLHLDSLVDTIGSTVLAVVQHLTHTRVTRRYGEVTNQDCDLEGTVLVYPQSMDDDTDQ